MRDYVYVDDLSSPCLVTSARLTASEDGRLRAEFCNLANLKGFSDFGINEACRTAINQDVEHQIFILWKGTRQIFLRDWLLKKTYSVFRHIRILTKLFLLLIDGCRHNK